MLPRRDSTGLFVRDLATAGPPGRDAAAARLDRGFLWDPAAAELFLFFQPTLLLSSSTRKKGFYPERPSSGQTVVTGLFSSFPRDLPSFLPRIGFSIPTYFSIFHAG